MDKAVPDHGLLEVLNVGVALGTVDTGAVLFENDCFGRWFPASGEQATLFDRLPGLDAERAAKRLAQGRPARWQGEIRQGPRAVTVQADLRQVQVDGIERLLVECRDITKQREAEYMLESYSRISEKNARALTREKERVEKLLLNIMPRAIYEELKEYGATTPQRFDAATVLVLDFAGFTQRALETEPTTLVAELNDIFASFDRIVELFGCERIKTIGDSYIAVSGVPEPNPDHAANIARVAMRMRRYIEKRNVAHEMQWACRIGIATGPLIGSLVGINKYVYDIIGPAVNLAARLESQCRSMQILVCAETCDAIKGEFSLTEIGAVELKGFGERTTFLLEGEGNDTLRWRSDGVSGGRDDMV